MLRGLYQYKSSINDKTLQDCLKEFDNTSQISSMLQNDVVRFDGWVQKIIETLNENHKYVSSITRCDRSWLSNQLKELKSYDRNQIAEVEKILRRQENIAFELITMMKNIFNVILDELNKHRRHVDKIAADIKNRNISPNKCLTDLTSIFPNESKCSQITNDINYCHQKSKHNFVIEWTKMFHSIYSINYNFLNK